MKVADAHCDTLTKFPENPFFDEKAHWNIPNFQKVNGILQYFALFTPPALNGDAALSFVFSAIGDFNRKNENHVVHLKSPSDFDENKINILLSIEGASPIINDINNLYAFYALGVRAMGLTWNHRNFLADGIDTDYGLTPFGFEIVKEMEKLKMIIDLSHINIAGFNDVLKTVNCPVICSHSNSRVILDHKRNLYDDQIQEIIKRNGFIGMNFYTEFLSGDINTSKVALYKHIEKLLNLGAENVLGMGADFDGIDSSPFPNVLSYEEIAENLFSEMGLSNDLVEKIMYKNLVDFTLNNI